MGKRILRKIAVGVTITMIVVGLPTVVRAAEPAASSVSLVFTTQPADAAGGTAFGTQPVVEFRDSDGALVPATGTVSLTIAGLSGDDDAALDCAPVAAVEGVASFADCSIDLVGSDYVLAAAADGAEVGGSAPFDVVPGAPAAVGFAVQPGDGIAGDELAAVALELQDAGGNTVDPTGYALGIVAIDATGAPEPVSNCVGSHAVDEQGAPFTAIVPAPGDTRAVFTECKITRAGDGYTLLGIGVPEDVAVTPVLGTSDEFDVAPGLISRLAFTQQPAGAAHGEPFVRQPTVTLQDAFGNTVPVSPEPSDPLTVQLYEEIDGASLTCTDSTERAVVDGVAIFDGCTLNGSPLTGSLPEVDFVLFAQLEGEHVLLDPYAPSPMRVRSTPFGPGVTQVDATAIEFVTQPGDATAGLPLDTQPAVGAAEGETFDGEVLFELVDAAGATLACTNPTALALGGVATASGCSIDRPGTYRLLATAGELTATSEEFEVTVGLPVSLQITDIPTGAVAGTPFPVGAMLVDAGGNQVATSGDLVRIALSPEPGTRAAGVVCTDGLAAPSDSGTVQFDGCRVNSPGSYRVFASSPAGIALSDPFAVTVGAPATVTFVSTPADAIDGGLLATPKVLVEDAGGNLLDAGVTLGISGGTLDGCDRSTIARRGVAAFSGCTLSAAGPSITLSATAGGQTTAATVPVSQAAIVGTAVTGVPLEQTFGGNVHAHNPTFVTNDVNGVTGALQFSDQDLTVAGIGVPFELRRTYNSWDDAPGVFGPGWSSILDAGVTIASDGRAIVRAEDGQRITFAPVTDCGKKKCSGYVAPAGSLVDLDCKKDTCTVTRHDGISFTSTDGLIQSYVNRSGYGLGFDYDGSGSLTAISLTTSGAPLSLDVTTADGLVTAIATPTRTVAYDYDGGLLAGATDPGGTTTSYDHDADQRISARTLGAARLDVAYGPDGRVTTASLTGQQRRFADRYDHSLDAATGIATTTRRSAVAAYGADTDAVHEEHHRDNVLLWERLPEGETLAYSRNERIEWTAFQDALGRVQRMSYDDRGNVAEIIAPDGGTTGLTYDDRHRVLRAVDQLGNTFEYEYSDDVLRWAVAPDPASASPLPGNRGSFGTHFDYDDWDQLIEVRTPEALRVLVRDDAGNEIGHQLFELDDVDRLFPVNGNGPRLAHDEAGNVISTVLASGHRDDGSVDPARQASFDYDAQGRLVEHRDPAGTVTSYAYTPAGEIAGITRPGSGTTTFSWDELSRTRTSTGAATGSWTYDAAGSLVRSTDDADRDTSVEYDRSANTIAQTGPTGFVTRQVHDAAGNVVRVVDAMGTQWAEHGYHGVERLVDGDLDQTSIFDLAGNVSEVINSEGRRSYRYDNHGNLASVTNGVGTTSYTYDTVGGLVSMTDAVGNVTTYRNDAAGQRSSTTVGSSTWTSVHDVDGFLASMTDPDGRATNYTVDANGRQTRIIHSQAGMPTVEISQDFDARGRRIGMTDPTGAHVFDYDDDDRLTRAAGPAGTFAYDYSVEGERTDTYPDGTEVTHRYNDAGQTMGLDAPGVNVDYARSRTGRLSAIANGNGLVEQRGYDADGRIVSQRLQCGASTVSTQRYGYDAASRLLGTQRTDGTQTTTVGFGYDDDSRLTATVVESTGVATEPEPCRDSAAPVPVPVPVPEPAPNPDPALAPPASLFDPVPEPGLDGLVPSTANALTYDAVGNRVSAAGTTYTYGTGGELLTGSDGRTASYDGAGNLIRSTVAGETTTYGYDAAGRLVDVGLPDGRTVSYVVDGDGLRVGKSIDGAPVATYHWDRRSSLPLLVLEDLAGADFRRYFYGVGVAAMQTATETFYVHSDGLANVAALSDDDGAIVSTYAYDAWGNVTEQHAADAPVMPLRYGSNLFDEDTGLHHLRARDYDASIGRFTARDSVTPAVGVPVLSPYVYALNLPTVYADASGRYAVPIRNVGYSDEGGMIAASRVGVSTSRFVGTKVLPKALMTKTAFRGASWAVAGSGGRGALGATAAIDDTVKFAGKAGKFLAVAGVALSVALVVVDCIYGTAYQCAGAVISLAFNVGCLAVSGGALSVLCAVAGIGLSYVVANYGPEIVQGTTDAAVGYARAIGIDRVSTSPTSVSGVIGVVIATAFGVACAVLTGGLLFPLCLAGAASLGVYLWAFGDEIDAAVAGAFNDLGDIISSGFDAFVDTMLSAGADAGRLIALLVNEFNLGAAAVIAAFEDLGVGIAEIAGEIGDFFASTPALMAQLFNDLGYEVDQIALAVEAGFDSAVGWSRQALAEALAHAGFAYGEIASAFTDAFNVSVDAMVSIGFALNYQASEIATALQDLAGLAATEFVSLANDLAVPFVAIGQSLAQVYNATVDEVVAQFAALELGVESLARAIDGAFSDVAGWSEEALVDTLAAAGYATDEIVRGLGAAFDLSEQALVEVLLGAGQTATEIAAALAEVYNSTVAEVAAAFVDAGVAVAEIAGAIGTAFGVGAGVISGVLSDAGAAIEELGAHFASVGRDIVDAINPANWFG